MRRISGIDPSKARSKFKRHIAGAIGDLSKEITSEVKKAVEDLTKQGIHLRGGKARIQELLARHNVDVKIIPESKKQNEKTPDIFIKWKKRKRIAVEMKNPTSSTYSTIKSHISHAIKQGCELLLLDLRNSPIAFNEIDVIIKRTIGSRPSRSLPIDLEVWINEYGKRRVYKRKKG